MNPRYRPSLDRAEQLARGARNRQELEAALQEARDAAAYRVAEFSAVLDCPHNPKGSDQVNCEGCRVWLEWRRETT